MTEMSGAPELEAQFGSDDSKRAFLTHLLRQTYIHGHYCLLLFTQSARVQPYDQRRVPTLPSAEYIQAQPLD